MVDFNVENKGKKGGDAMDPIVIGLIVAVIASTIGLVLLFCFCPRKKPENLFIQPSDGAESKKTIQVFPVEINRDERPELAGETIYKTPATIVGKDGRTAETKIAIKDSGGWVVVWDNGLSFLDNFIVAGSKAEVTFEDGKLSLAPAAMTGVYVITQDHDTPEPLEAMFERLLEVETAWLNPS